LLTLYRDICISDWVEGQTACCIDQKFTELLIRNIKSNCHCVHRSMISLLHSRKRLKKSCKNWNHLHPGFTYFTALH